MRLAIYRRKQVSSNYHVVTVKLFYREIAGLMGDPVLSTPKVEDEIYVKVDTQDIKNFKITLSNPSDPESYKLNLSQISATLFGIVTIPVNKFGKQLFQTTLKSRSPVSLTVKPYEVVADISNLKPEVLTREQIQARYRSGAKSSTDATDFSNFSSSSSTVTASSPTDTVSDANIENIQNQVMANLVAMGLKVNANGRLAFEKTAEAHVAPRSGKKTVVLHRPEMLGALISSTENVDIVDNLGNLLVSC